MRNISAKAINRRMLRDWNSTMEMRSRAPHQELWPSNWNCKDKNKDLV